MLPKGDRTKARILEKATELFIEKGYSSVTMKDVCDATGLSRGGLYRHFSSTADMIVLLMDEEQNNADEMANDQTAQHISAVKMLDSFLNQHMEFMLSDRGRLELAFQQFAQTDERGRDQNRKRVYKAVMRTARLIQAGQAEGVFVDGDPYNLALHTMLSIGGMRTMAPLIGWGREITEREMDTIRSLLIKKQEEK